ncbi:MAG TPA: transglutaminase-like domain-containing protein [Steroidobacteraceae bacterium]|jgi:transglutaminase-like putative cysteine protease|nr:transglutaminase-like domain-containing protein [Steroidobacteraceae bacterium]
MSNKFLTRRQFVQAASGSIAAMSLPASSWSAADDVRVFQPHPGDWRTFEVVTTIQPRELVGSTTVWVPIPSVTSGWQRTLANNFSGNATMARQVSLADDTQAVMAQFDAGTAEPSLQVISRVQTQSRAMPDRSRHTQKLSAAERKLWLHSTAYKPTDGVVRKTADQITAGAHGDLAKAQRIYDWIVVNTYREPKVRGCGPGDIKALLETGNLGGKCADLNGLFVGLCRAAGLPARDAYGVRLAPSEFGYRELGGKPATLQGAQHCRAEVFLEDYGWVAMDPADVDKVMRQETSEWIKDADNPLVAPVRKGLFGGWEGNWMAYNQSDDLALVGSSGPPLAFFMYPQAENEKGRYDSLDAAAFTYTISSREIAA